MVPTRSGLVDPRTLEVTPMQPEHYATWRIEVEYDPAAKCPHWLRMLEDAFGDRSPSVRAATIGVIQELLGAGLIDRKPRGLSKALILHGGIQRRQIWFAGGARRIVRIGGQRHGAQDARGTARHDGICAPAALGSS